MSTAINIGKKFSIKRATEKVHIKGFDKGMKSKKSEISRHCQYADNILKYKLTIICLKRLESQKRQKHKDEWSRFCGVGSCSGLWWHLIKATLLACSLPPGNIPPALMFTTQRLENTHQHAHTRTANGLH